MSVADAAAAADKGKEKVEEPVPPARAAGGGNGRFMAYPARMAEHKSVVADAALFRAELEKLHAHMGTKLKSSSYFLPIYPTSHHSICKYVKSEGQIDNCLCCCLAQLYFFGGQGWYQQESDHVFTADPRSLPCIEVRAETQNIDKRKRATNASSDPALASDNVDVDVIIDGKFEHGYIVTVITGSKSTKAVLYNYSEEPALTTLAPTMHVNNTASKGGRRRRQRRKKLSTTDPRHPKPNRSGYNFFFQDQHRKLKPDYPGQDRLISKMIGERWNNLSPEDKAVYQERGVQDKERYQSQLAAYKEELRTGQPMSNPMPIIGNAPIQQTFPQTEVTIDEVDSKVSKGDMLLSNQRYNNSDEGVDSGGKLVEDEEFNTDTSPEPSIDTTDSPGLLDPSADGDRFELRRRENPNKNEKQSTAPK
uniref:Non-histone chromosomal protein 6 n=1 Tax=Aegilops tauschii TaxID=37682 RepID=M8BHS9_AEGTA